MRCDCGYIFERVLPVLSKLPDNPEQAQEHRNLASSFLLLFGMSIISGLLIFAIQIIPYDCYEMCIGTLVIKIGVPWLLVIPVTILVTFIHARLSPQDKSYGIPLAIRASIPLVFNTLGAASAILLLYL